MKPIDDPILVFAVLAFVMLSAPIFAERFRLPDIVFLIAAGAILGPNGIGVLAQSSAIELFGAVGLLYIMFLAGLEINLYQFMRSKGRTVTYGFITFLIPQIIGALGAHYYLSMDWTPSILLASMFASHTLLAYPVASRLGISRTEPVGITVGATIITDTLALLVLAIIVDAAKGIPMTAGFWVSISAGMTALVALIWLGVPFIARWFFQTFTSRGSEQFMFVLLVVCFFSYLSHYASLEPIIGAFLAGAAFNRMIPEHSPLMNRLVFAGNTMFIPFFLISVGMLVDGVALISDAESIKVGMTMVVLVVTTKYIAAHLTRLIFGYCRDSGNVMFGLSVVQAAATLAAVLIGHEYGIFNDSILNGTIAMILITCPLGAWMVEKAGRKLALKEPVKMVAPRKEQRILVPVSDQEKADDLLQIAFMLRDQEIPGGIYPLTIVDSDENVAWGEKLLAGTVNSAAAVDMSVMPGLRIDMNPVDGIARAANEYRASIAVAGWGNRHRRGAKLFNSVRNQLEDSLTCRMAFCRIVKPINTIKRILMTLPPLSERQPDFPEMIKDVRVLAKQSGAKLKVFIIKEYLSELSADILGTKPEGPVEFHEYSSFRDARTQLLNAIEDEDMIILPHERNRGLLWNPALESLALQVLSKNSDNNLIVMYPGIMEENRNGRNCSNDNEDSIFNIHSVELPERHSLKEMISYISLEASKVNGEKLISAEDSLMRSVLTFPIELAEGFVLLHAHCERLSETQLMIVHISESINIDKVSYPVNYIMVLLSPASSSPEHHLKILSMIARPFHLEATADKLKTSENAKEVADIMSSVKGDRSCLE